MDRFNTPPGWPAPPDADWQPPVGWQPDPSWPPAPRGWRFWVNERGARTLGPRGRYGAVGRGRLVAGGTAGAVLLLIGISALAGGTGDAASSGPPGAGPTVTAPAVPGPTVTVARTVPGPTVTVAAAPRGAPTVTVTRPRATVTVTARPKPQVRVAPTTPAPETTPAEPESGVYYANCAAARAAGVAPLRTGDPGYASHLDRDKDGIACE